MAVVHTDFYRHENLVRKSIQIPSTQHKELKALAVELDSSLGDVVETIMEIMQRCCCDLPSRRDHLRRFQSPTSD